MTTSTDKPDLTLYGIETQLLELLNFRDSILEDPDMLPSDQKASLEAIDAQILFYVSAEVKKCDGIARYLKEFQTRAKALNDEAARYTAKAKTWEGMHRNLENMVINIMQQMGKTRIDGVHSVLQLKKNPPSSEITQLDMVPNELLRVPVKLSLAEWWGIVGVLRDAGYDKRSVLELAIGQANAEPMKAEILKRLKEGDGVPGCWLKTDGVRLEVK